MREDARHAVNAPDRTITTSYAATSEPPGIAELVARAIEKAGDIRYSLLLVTSDGDDTSWTLTYADGGGSFDFDTDAAAREHVSRRRSLAMALAALALIEGRQSKARRGPWKVVVSDWGYPNILPADGNVLAYDSIAEFRVRQGHPDGQERAKALAEYFVVAANAHAAVEATGGESPEGPVRHG